MKGKHWAIVGGMLVAIATQLSGVQHWHEVLTPLFVSGVTMQVGVVLVSIYTDKAEQKP
jgi:hypothetical protein